MYKDVLVAWNDNPDQWFSTKVAIGVEWDGEDDPDVFHYFDDIEEYESHKVFDSKYEFTLKEDN